MTTCEVRLKAAAEIETHGLAKYQLQDEYGCLCVMGAINTAVSGDFSHPRTARKVRTVVAVVKAMGFTNTRSLNDIVAWNNAPERTAAEVIARLRDGCSEPAS